MATLETDWGRLDIMFEVEGVHDVYEAFQRGNAIELRGRRFLVASIDDLIAMKESAGRPKNILHLSELRAIKAALDEGDQA